MKTASARDVRGVESDFSDFNVSAPMRRPYEAVLLDGPVLRWIRATDEGALGPARILRKHNGLHVGSHSG